MSLKTVIAKIRWKDFFNIKSLFFIALGNLIYALGVVMFILPNGLITGGHYRTGTFHVPPVWRSRFHLCRYF